MARVVDHLRILDTMLTEAAERGLLHLDVEGASLDGRTIHLGGRPLVNFGSCSYLGLEVDERLKQGAMEALVRYGTQFSSSRAYLSAPPYAELEAIFETLFEAPALLAPTTTLAHLAALPVLVGEHDAVLLDQQVHHSVQMAANQLRLRRVHVELVRHNRVDDIEAKIEALAGRFRRIWYLADGVYSMYGDLAPMKDLVRLMDRHDAFHVYLDDAHGMSWAGQNGRGYVLGEVPMRPQVVVAVSLAKAFGAGGGVLVFPDRELHRRVRTCGGPLIFSGPLQPPTLGACLASARLHLGPELPPLQQALQERIAYTHQRLVEAGLPVTSSPTSPIHFVGMGLPRVASAMVERLLADGFYTNLAIFPAVPMRRAGVRFTTTCHQSFADIDALIAAIARHMPAALAEGGSSPREVRRVFALGEPEASSAPVEQLPVALEMTVAAGPRLEHHTGIAAVDAAEWDRLLGANGTFTWEGLRCLEEAFRDNPEPENNWRFHYYLVRDARDTPILATFFTEALWKDDMLSPVDVSAAAEARRSEEPYFLTSTKIAMGSLLTEGNHLYLDRGADWQGAMKLLLAAVAAEQDRRGCAGVALRDLAGDDPELAAFLHDQGFPRFAEMDSLVIDVEWNDDETYLAWLSQKARKHQRKKVLPFDGFYRAEVLGHATRPPTPAESAHFHALYRSVKARNLELNTFELPGKLFDVLAASPAWELLALYLRPEHGGRDGDLPVAVSASFLGPGTYVPLIFGLDYRYVETHGAYRQLFRHVIGRARQLGARRIPCGMGATFEKTRFGATTHTRAIHYQAADHFHLEALAHLEAEAARTGSPRQP